MFFLCLRCFFPGLQLPRVQRHTCVANFFEHFSRVSVHRWEWLSGCLCVLVQDKVEVEDFDGRAG